MKLIIPLILLALLVGCDHPILEESPKHPHGSVCYIDDQRVLVQFSYSNGDARVMYMDLGYEEPLTIHVEYDQLDCQKRNF